MMAAPPCLPLPLLFLLTMGYGGLVIGSKYTRGYFDLQQRRKGFLLPKEIEEMQQLLRLS